ncbi:hypothetical protein ACHAWF_009686 [Thalassiosira exigua]
MKVRTPDKYKMELELVLPDCHLHNIAKVAINNFKSHFLSILEGVTNNFPLQLWDCLIPQAEITVPPVPIQHAPRTNGLQCPSPREYQQSQQLGLSPIDGWYLSTSPKNDCTQTCHVKDTCSDRLSDTLSPADKLVKAIAKCTNILKDMGANCTMPHLPQSPQEPLSNVPLSRSTPLSAQRVVELIPRLEGAVIHSMNHQSAVVPPTPDNSTRVPRVQTSPTPRVPTRQPPPPQRRPRHPQSPDTDCPAMNTRVCLLSTTAAAMPLAARTHSKTAALPDRPRSQPRRSRIPPPSASCRSTRV